MRGVSARDVWIRSQGRPTSWTGRPWVSDDIGPARAPGVMNREGESLDLGMHRLDLNGVRWFDTR